MPAILRNHGALIGLGLMVAVFALLLPETFLTARNLLNIAQQMSMLAVVALTMTIVMTLGDFDLSVGSMASLAAIIAALLFQATGSVAAGIIGGLALGALGGAANGVLVARIGILPFVATLGTLTMFSGAAFLASGGKTIFGAAIPKAFSAIASGGLPLGMADGRPLILPNLVLIAAVVFALTAFLMRRTALGRHMRAIGGNAEAARLAGVNVSRVRIIAFTLSGAGAALAGLMIASRVASANPIQGAGLMLDAIAAVFLGMSMSRNGEPQPALTLAGVAALGLLSNGLTQLSIDSYVREILVGAIILSAVAMSGAGRRRD
jgi:ribose transport system permease protein